MTNQTQIKILHTADLHLGHTPSKDAVSQTYKKLVKDAPYLALNKLVEVAVENQVDAFVLAGDVFDKGPKPKIFNAFVDCLQPLDREGVPVLIVCGNHDGYNTWSEFLQKLPPNIFVFDANMMSTYNLEAQDGKSVCQFIGQSLADKGYMQHSIVEGLKVQTFDPDGQFPIHIGVLHVGADENKQSPIDMIDFAKSGCDYVALGHIHKAGMQRLNNVTVSYCGTPQGQDIGEPARESFSGGENGYFANLVTINKNVDTCSVNVEQVPCTNVVFEKLSVDISEVKSRDEIIKRVYKKTMDVKHVNNCTNIICRIELTGMTQMHNWLSQRQHLDDLQIEICKACNIECSLLLCSTQMLYNEKQLANAGGVPSLIAEVSHQMAQDESPAVNIIQQFLNDNKRVAVDSLVIDNLDMKKLVSDAQIEAVSAVSPKLEED